MKQKHAFFDYCWSFYGPDGIYGDFFGYSLTREILETAIQLYTLTAPHFVGDSFDRECVRELLLLAFNRQELAKKAIG